MGHRTNGEPVLDIFLIRHTRVQVAEGTCYGQTDVRLSDTFDAEFAAIQAKLPVFSQPVQVISSPLSRCLQLAARLSYKIKTDPRIMELHFGDWEMKSWEDLTNKQISQWAEDYIHSAPPNGESYQALYDRCTAFWTELVAQELEQVVIVTHTGVIRALVAHVLELPLHKSFSLHFDYGAVSHLVFHRDWTRVVYLNR
ncbi:alpha-ribazole phosphatase [Thioflexithrix psekupsensis]|uniref:alpha-ribazole phosphatase n=1 Tax=Thioflexithrix psekupsensis TaxID=1570016 RepID=UPI001FDAAC0A|nr:alpha-ribazole phosphatase [Thioflexithrix psekupsensis]